MEGIAGVVHEDQTNPIDPRCAGEYGRFRQLMTAEANSAIEGSLAGGATAVLVNDSHWLMRNLLAEELHPAAELISGGPKTHSMMEGIERGADLALFVGYHAKAGTPAAILDHTYTDRILDVRLNGRSVGEVGLNAALAGSFGVSVGMVTGDSAVSAESRRLLGEALVVVEVKEAVSRHAARSLSPEEARKRIRAGAEEAFRRRAAGKTVRPFTLDSPVGLEVDFTKTVEADLAAMTPGASRTGGRTVAFTHSDYREAFRALRTMFNLAGGA
jgi:D-amino peptidase